jgi:hypothetical protein
MRNNTSLSSILFMLAASFFFSSCQKSIQEQTGVTETAATANKSNQNNSRVVPYQFERINEHNFSSQGWREQQVTNVSGMQIFLDGSDFMEIVCGPENNSDPRMVKGCFSMNLPIAQNPTLRRVRLWKGGYSGTHLADLTEFKYSTYVVNISAPAPVLQIDVNNDGKLDFNMWLDPRGEYQEDPNFPPVVLNTWQQWNLLEGTWHSELATISGVPISGVPVQFTIEALVVLFPDARIIDLPATGGIGEGIRFNLDRNFDPNSISYLDGLIIGTKNKPISTVFDFTCDASGN